MKKVALILIGIMFAIFLLQLKYDITGSFTTLRGAWTEVWRLVTHMFLHGSWAHLFSNMFALGIFGFILNNIIGNKKFLMVFLLTGFVAGLASSVMYASSLGASGAIFGIMGCLAVLRPRLMVWVSYIPMPMYAAVAVWFALDMLGVFYPTNVANFAHIFGLLSGLAIGWIIKNEYGLNERKTKVVLDEENVRLWENNYL